MKSIKGTRTEKNLLASFAGESQAKNRYQFFAKQARKEEYEYIADVFEETARNEESHAKTFFRFLEGGMVEITASYPAGIIGTTAENLKAAAAGEREEYTELYPEFARIAKEEGFEDIARSWRFIAEVEREHEARFLDLKEMVSSGTFFKRSEPVRWKCRKCGHIHISKEAPNICPTCAHPQAFFETDMATR